MTAEPQVRLAVLLLVDERGWVLLQERDEHAARAADQWGLPGGHVEDGEEVEDAAYRELEEETGLTPERGELILWRTEDFCYSDADEPFRYWLYAARTGATDADIVVGEGRQIVFVDPAEVPGLDTSESAAHFVPAFLASDAYRELRAG